MNTQKSFVCLAAILIGIVSVAFADIPRLISYQGKLTNTSGTPLDGIYSFVFTLYDAPSAGTPVWTETQTSVSITGGLYSVILGTTTPFVDVPGNFNEPYWLQITVNGEVLSPRQLLTSSPYTFALPSTTAVTFSSVTVTNTINAAHLVGDGSGITNVGGASIIDFNVRISTGIIQAQLTDVVASTGTLRTQVDGLFVSTGTLQGQFVNVGASTQTLRSDVTSLQQSTGTLQLQISDFKVSPSTGIIDGKIADGVKIATGNVSAAFGTPSNTTFWRGDNQWVIPTGTIDGAAIGASTQTLRNDVTTLQQSTGTLKSQFVTVGASTQTLRTDVMALQQSTGTLKSQFVGVKDSTTSLQGQIDAISAATVSTIVIVSDLATLNATLSNTTIKAGYTFFYVIGKSLYVAFQDVTDTTSWYVRTNFVQN